MKQIKRVLCITIMMALVFTCMPLANGRVYAASKKKPAAPVITYAKDLADYESFTLIKVKWKKAKNAKKYQVAVRSAKKKWVKVKTVKKSKANKRKYTKKNKYKVVAKGKKYKVYKYQYKYLILGETKGKSIQINDNDLWSFDRNTTYIIAVRSVNGKKHSKWKTAIVKTGHDGEAQKVLTKDGEKTTVSFNGKSLTITVGKECAFPVPQTKTGLVEAKGVTFTPKKIYYDYWYNKDGSVNSATVGVTGKKSDGFDAYWEINVDYGKAINVSYTIEHPTFNSDKSKFHFKDEYFNSGDVRTFRGMTKVVSEDPDVRIFWTLDGTCPPNMKNTQIPKTIKASEYPFGKVCINRKPYSGDLTVRGISTQGSDSYMWPSYITDYCKSCEWIRVYNGSQLNPSLVYESFYCSDY